MTAERNTLLSECDELKLGILTMVPDDAPKGIVQIAHGMAEHKERYVPLMEHLARHGYASVIHDHRGHGASVFGEDDLGYLGANAADALVEDLHSVNAWARNHWPQQPVYLLGHSLGSLVARVYLKRYHDLDALILSGTPSYNAAVVPAGCLLSLLGKIHGDHYRSNFIDSLFFGTYSRKFKKSASKFAWINSDAALVREYENDPLCGFVFTVNGYQCVRDILMDAYSVKGWEDGKSSMPVLFLSGEDDPCMISREKLSVAVNLLRNAGYHRVKVKVYPGMRHEILNEPGRFGVYDDIVMFLEEARTTSGAL